MSEQSDKGHIAAKTGDALIAAAANFADDRCDDALLVGATSIAKGVQLLPPTDAPSRRA
jgi:hypothetical protein